MVFRLAASAVDIFIENASVADFQIGDDEVCVEPFRAGLDTGDDALDTTPARGPVQKFLEAAHFSIFWYGVEAGFRAGFQRFDMGAQRRGGRDAENVVETVGPTPVENLGAAIMAVGAQHDFRLRPVGAARAQEAPQKGAGLRALWPFGGTQHGGDKGPPPSNTTIGWKPYSS